MDRGVWQATVYGVVRVRHDLTTKPPPPPLIVLCNTLFKKSRSLKIALQTNTH